MFFLNIILLSLVKSFKTLLYAYWKEAGDTAAIPICLDLKETSWVRRMRTHC